MECRETEINVELELLQKRIQKMITGEILSDEVITDPLKSFEVNVLNVIVGIITNSLKFGLC